MAGKLGLSEQNQGRWHVVYQDGQRSVGMDYMTAMGYMRIFKARYVEGTFLGHEVRSTSFNYLFAICA